MKKGSLSGLPQRVSISRGASKNRDLSLAERHDYEGLMPILPVMGSLIFFDYR